MSYDRSKEMLLVDANKLDTLISKEKDLQNDLSKLDERMDIYKNEVTAAEEKEIELLNKISMHLKE